MRPVAMLVVAALAGVCTGASAADANIALDKPITLSGTFYDNPAGWTGSNGAAPSSVTDGVFVTDRQQWNIGTVWWNTGYSSNYIQIDLNGVFNVSQLTLQADNNDYYHVQYQSPANTWVDLLNMKPPADWGMKTVTTSLSQVISARAFRISDGPYGDCCDAVSEFQAFGVAAVPEPESYGMMLGGLALIGLIFRRRRHDCAPRPQ